MWFNGKFWDIEEFEEAIKDHFLHSLEPTRRADPSYDWKETTKRKKQI